MPSMNRVMVSIPRSLKARLDRLSIEMLAGYEQGKGYSDIQLSEQGTKGTWVPLHAVISKALDELESHRERSNRSKSRTSTV